MKPNYDKSTKPFEVLIKIYLFDKQTRKLIREPIWKHWKYYNTLESAKDAIRDFRIIHSNFLYNRYYGRNRFKAIKKIGGKRN